MEEKWDGTERRSWLSRFLDREWLVLLVLGVIFTLAGLCGWLVLMIMQ